jgi:formylglycine-generating enzyme required for sulfatase activity
MLPPEAPTVPLEDPPAGESDTQAPGPSIELGAILAGRYKLISILGEGGSGRVYEAMDLDRPSADTDKGIIALKVLTQTFDETAGHFAALCAQFNRWKRLLHPFIVRLFDCERDGPTVFITMEYVPGESVYSKLHGQRGSDASPSPLDPGQGRMIIASVAQALDYAHGQNLVHGDLKPGNVMVASNLEVKVIDFCMARWRSRPHGTGGLRAATTPRYASPQVMAGEKPIPSDDVFSLAFFAYEILTGSPPFESVGDPPSAGPPRRRGLTPGEHAALVHALQPDRAHRTATISEFMSEFNAAPRRPLPASWPVWLLAGAVIALGCWLFYRSPARTTRVQPQTVVTPSAGTPPPAESADNKPGTPIHDCSTCPPMAVMPAGEFEQGAAEDEGEASLLAMPRHLVRIGHALSMSTSDITVDDFRRFVIATGRDMQGCDTYDGEWRHRRAASWEDPGFKQSGLHPVTCISWSDAVAYAGWLSKSSGHRYRLPSASEWEYAARAGSSEVRPWASDATSACAHANVADRSAERRFPGWAVFPCDDGFVFTAPAGTFKANAFGLHDMLGNVLVWTQDCWHPGYAGAPGDGSAREQIDCREHEVRGGSWFSSPPAVTAAARNHFAASYRTSSLGFRLVRDLE